MLAVQPRWSNHNDLWAVFRTEGKHAVVVCESRDEALTLAANFVRLGTDIENFEQDYLGALLRNEATA